MSIYIFTNDRAGKTAQRSSVRMCVSVRIAGAASSTIGSIMIQATNQDCSQWATKDPAARKGTFATPVAIAQVRPDCMTP